MEIRLQRSRALVSLVVLGFGAWSATAFAGGPPSAEIRGEDSSAPARLAEQGYELLRTKAFLPADLDEDVFNALPEVWEEPLRSQAAKASPLERRRMTMTRYGLTPSPEDPTKPLQYVVGDDGSWTMSCLACHQGQVAGRAIPGVPNSTYALESLTEDVRRTKVRQGKRLGTMDLGFLMLPLGTTVGTTNAVAFGLALMHHRDRDLNLINKAPRFDLPHHDMDAPPWWHVAKKRRLYIDGFAPSNHRVLMQFLLVKENGPEQLRAWEEDFRAIDAWIESLEAPAWPWDVDTAVAERGKVVFEAHCSRCHGTYDASGDIYPERMVPIDEIGTDRVRFDSLTPQNRRDLIDSWMGHYGEDEGLAAPEGYVAPPLDGIWATAPYLHNGSVPTLWHLLHPEQRPAVWKRSPDGYDQKLVGLEIEVFDGLPNAEIMPSAERRRHFDTSKRGKSAAGHTFPDALSGEEKRAVLEFLKTL